MATRIYFPSSGAAAVTPSSWAFAAQSTGTLLTYAGTTSRASTSTATSVTHPTGTTSPILRGCVRYVIGPLSAQSISGTIKGQLRCLENNANANATLALAIKLIQPNGTDRSVLLAATAADTTTTPPEMGTSIMNRRFQNSAESFAPTLTTQSATSGDYLVIEIGFRSATATTRNIDLNIGIPSTTTDLAENETTTAAENPWIEFTATLSFIDTTPLAATLPGTGACATPVLSTAIRFAATAAGTATASATTLDMVAPATPAESRTVVRWVGPGGWRHRQWSRRVLYRLQPFPAIADHRAIAAIVSGTATVSADLTAPGTPIALEALVAGTGTVWLGDLTLSGYFSREWATGPTEDYLTFAGTDLFGARGTMEPFSVGLWFRVDSSQSAVCPLVRVRGSHGEWSVSIFPSTFMIASTAVTAGASASAFSAAPTQGLWQQAIGYFSASALRRCYTNGAAGSDETTTVTHNAANTIVSIDIGQFDGAIDGGPLRIAHVAIWPFLLTATQIARLQGNPPSAVPGALLHWSLEGTLYDRVQGAQLSEFYGGGGLYASTWSTDGPSFFVQAALLAEPRGFAACTATTLTSAGAAAALEATVAGTGSVTAALTTAIRFVATCAGTGTTSATTLSTAIRLVGTAAGTGTATATTLSTAIPLAATAAGTGTVTAPLTAGTGFQATPAGTGGLTATLTTSISFAGTAAGTGTCASPSLSTAIRFAQTLAGTGTATATTLATAIRLASTAAGTGALTAPVLSTAIRFVAAPTGSATCTATTLATAIPLVATAAGVGTASATTLTVGIGLAATAAGVGTATTTSLTTSIPLAVSLSGTAATTAALSTAIRFAATPAGAGTVTAPLTTPTNFGATLAGSGALTASLTTTIGLSTTAAGTASATGALSTAITMAVTLGGTATLSSPFLLVGETLLSTAAGVGTLTAALSTGIRFAVSTGGTGTLTAALTAVGPTFAASLSGSSALTAALSTGPAIFAASLTGIGTFSGPLTTSGGVLLAALQGTATLTTTTLTTAIPLGAALAARGSLQGSLSPHLLLASAATGTGSLTAVLTIPFAPLAIFAGELQASPLDAYWQVPAQPQAVGLEGRRL